MFGQGLHPLRIAVPAQDRRSVGEESHERMHADQARMLAFDPNRPISGGDSDVVNKY